MVVRIAPARTVTIRPILFVVVAAQVADAISFAIGVSRLGIGVEGNPLMRAAHDVSGTAGVLGIKTLAIAVVLAMLISAGDRFPRFATIGSYVAIVLGLLGAVINTTVMILLAVAA